MKKGFTYSVLTGPYVAPDAVHAAGKCVRCRDRDCEYRRTLQAARRACRRVIIQVSHPKTGSYVTYDPTEQHGRILAVRELESVIRRHRHRLNRRVLPSSWRQFTPAEWLSTAHVPFSTGEHVGIEIECYVPSQESLRKAIGSLGYWVELTRDGSLTSNLGQGVELCVCIPIRSMQSVLTRVCDILAAQKAVVDETCGLHVHLDCRSRDLETTASRLAKCYMWLRAVVAPSRLKSRYCLPPPTAKDSRRTRYRAINTTAYDEHKTLEVRLHQGTVEAPKIIAWTNLLRAIADTPLSRCPHDAATLARRLQLDAVTHAWIVARAERWGWRGGLRARRQVKETTTCAA